MHGDPTQPSRPAALSADTGTPLLAAAGAGVHRSARSDGRAADMSGGRAWSTRSLVATGATCFIAGALAWHLVGFWSFVSAIVYDRDDPASARSAPQTLAKTSGTQTLVRANPAMTTAPEQVVAAKPGLTVSGAQRPPASADSLAELLQCAEARKGATEADVHACPPLRRRLPLANVSSRGNRQLDAQEAARRLATGWQTGVARIETGSLPAQR